MAGKKIFFQSSMPRSGSTMFQNLMHQNPDFYCTPTSGVLEFVYSARAQYTNSPEFSAQDADLMKKGFLNFCKEGMNGFYEAITDKKYVLDKSRGWGIHYDFLNQIFAEPKIICLVRDLRDIICSMEKNFRKSQDKSSAMVDHALMKGTSTPKRVDMWLSSGPVGLALERLSEIFRQGINEKMLFVKYEDLCLYPEREMVRVYDYLGIKYYQHDFDNIEQITKEDDTVYGVFGDHVIRKKLEPLKSTARSVLGPDVYDWFYKNEGLAWYFQKFNYRK